MNREDYLQEVKDDVTEYIRNEVNFFDYSDREELEEKLNECLWSEDSVTGNTSGSYTFNSWQAEENICHCSDLVEEVYSEFGGTPDYTNAEAIDVSIRCYLLSSAISEVLDNMEEELDNAFNSEE